VCGNIFIGYRFGKIKCIISSSFSGKGGGDNFGVSKNKILFVYFIF